MVWKLLQCILIWSSTSDLHFVPAVESNYTWAPLLPSTGQAPGCSRTRRSSSSAASSPQTRRILCWGRGRRLSWRSRSRWQEPGKVCPEVIIKNNAPAHEPLSNASLPRVCYLYQIYVESGPLSLRLTTSEIFMFWGRNMQTVTGSQTLVSVSKWTPSIPGGKSRGAARSDPMTGWVAIQTYSLVVRPIFLACLRISWLSFLVA